MNEGERCCTCGLYTRLADRDRLSNSDFDKITDGPAEIASPSAVIPGMGYHLGRKLPGRARMALLHYPTNRLLSPLPRYALRLNIAYGTLVVLWVGLR